MFIIKVVFKDGSGQLCATEWYDQVSAHSSSAIEKTMNTIHERMYHTGVWREVASVTVEDILPACPIG